MVSKKKKYSWLAVALAIFFAGCGAGYLSLITARDMVRVASCANDIKMFEFALNDYSLAHDGYLPLISSTTGNLMTDPDGFYPDYMWNTCYAQCEYSHARRPPGKNDRIDEDMGPGALNDDSFCFLPWELRTEKEGLAFIEAYKSLDMNQRENDLTVVVDGKEVVLQRTRISPDEPNAYYADAERIPILVEWPNRCHPNANVLFADGSYRRMDVGDGFPMTEKFLAGLREIASINGTLAPK